MPITVDTTRPKADVDKDLALAVELGTPIEDDVIDSFFIPVNATGLDIPDFIVLGVTTVLSSDIVTTTGDGFVGVSVGDAIAAGTAVPATTVIAVTDNNTIQIAAPATADGAEDLTFTPVGGGTGLTITLLGIEIQLVPNASGSITVNYIGHVYDGSLGGTAGTNLNSTSQINLNQSNLDLDSLFETARIPREN